MNTQINIYKLLPQVGAISRWIVQKEREAEKLFGLEMKLWFLETSNTLAIDTICKMVSDVLSVSVSSIMSESRETSEKDARFVIIYLCKKHIPNVTSVDLAKYFKKDHTTILHANRKVHDLLSVEDKSITIKIAECELELLKRINE